MNPVNNSDTNESLHSIWSFYATSGQPQLPQLSNPTGDEFIIALEEWVTSTTSTGTLNYSSSHIDPSFTGDSCEFASSQSLINQENAINSSLGQPEENAETSSANAATISQTSHVFMDDVFDPIYGPIQTPLDSTWAGEEPSKPLMQLDFNSLFESCSTEGTFETNEQSSSILHCDESDITILQNSNELPLSSKRSAPPMFSQASNECLHAQKRPRLTESDIYDEQNEEVAGLNASNRRVVSDNQFCIDLTDEPSSPLSEPERTYINVPDEDECQSHEIASAVPPTTSAMNPPRRIFREEDFVPLFNCKLNDFQKLAVTQILLSHYGDNIRPVLATEMGVSHTSMLISVFTDVYSRSTEMSHSIYICENAVLAQTAVEARHLLLESLTTAWFICAKENDIDWEDNAKKVIYKIVKHPKPDPYSLRLCLYLCNLLRQHDSRWTIPQFEAKIKKFRDIILNLLNNYLIELNAKLSASERVELAELLLQQVEEWVPEERQRRPLREKLTAVSSGESLQSLAEAFDIEKLPAVLVAVASTIFGFCPELRKMRIMPAINRAQKLIQLTPMDVVEADCKTVKKIAPTEPSIFFVNSSNLKQLISQINAYKAYGFNIPIQGVFIDNLPDMHAGKGNTYNELAELCNEGQMRVFVSTEASFCSSLEDLTRLINLGNSHHLSPLKLHELIKKLKYNNTVALNALINNGKRAVGRTGGLEENQADMNRVMLSFVQMYRFKECLLPKYLLPYSTHALAPTTLSRENLAPIISLLPELSATLNQLFLRSLTFNINAYFSDEARLVRNLSAYDSKAIKAIIFPESELDVETFESPKLAEFYNKISKCHSGSELQGIINQSPLLRFLTRSEKVKCVIKQKGKIVFSYRHRLVGNIVQQLFVKKYQKFISTNILEDNAALQAERVQEWYQGARPNAAVLFLPDSEKTSLNLADVNLIIMLEPSSIPAENERIISQIGRLNAHGQVSVLWPMQDGDSYGYRKVIADEKTVMSKFCFSDPMQSMDDQQKMWFEVLLSLATQIVFNETKDWPTTHTIREKMQNFLDQIRTGGQQQLAGCMAQVGAIPPHLITH